jgi:hypothetical protein
MEEVTWVFTLRFMRMCGLHLTWKDVERDCSVQFEDKITAFREVEGNHKNDTV